MNIEEAIELITNELYDSRLEKSSDKVLAGDPTCELTGIVTTFLATCEVIQKASSMGCNLIISHEPVFYGHLDKVELPSANSVLKEKLTLIEETGVTIWRLHDHKHKKTLDPVLDALTARLGWHDFRDELNYRIFYLPKIKLSDLLSMIKTRLGLEYIRYVGDENQNCRKVGILVGAPAGIRQVSFMDENDLDVLICGEINEWEISVYIKDANFIGVKKALVVTGHEESERDAMVLLAERLKEIIPGCPVSYIPSTGLYGIRVY